MSSSSLFPQAEMDISVQNILVYRSPLKSMILGLLILVSLVQLPFSTADLYIEHGLYLQHCTGGLLLSHSRPRVVY